MCVFHGDKKMCKIAKSHRGPNKLFSSYSSSQSRIMDGNQFDYRECDIKSENWH